MRANAAAKERATGAAAYQHPSQGAPGIVDASRQGYGGGGAAPAGGHVEDGVGETCPIARGTGTARPSAAHKDPRSSSPSSRGGRHLALFFSSSRGGLFLAGPWI